MFDYYPDPSTITIDQLRVAVSAIVWDDKGRLLLQQRGDNGYWGFPGGGVEPGETVTEAVMREVWEETGFKIQPGRLIGVYSDPRNYQVVRYPEGNVVHYVTIVFEAAVTSGVATLCDETSAIEWRPPDALPEPFVPSHRIRLADALARTDAAFVR
jgi:8-oxo-dGTP pyrophosphatase MutT (NUDIX family)